MQAMRGAGGGQNQQKIAWLSAGSGGLRQCWRESHHCGANRQWENPHCSRSCRSGVSAQAGSPCPLLDCNCGSSRATNRQEMHLRMLVWWKKAGLSSCKAYDVIHMALPLKLSTTSSHLSFLCDHAHVTRTCKPFLHLRHHSKAVHCGSMLSAMSVADAGVFRAARCIPDGVACFSSENPINGQRWPSALQRYCVLVMTAQAFLNMLEEGDATLHSFDLMVSSFPQCHVVRPNLCCILYSNM